MVVLKIKAEFRLKLKRRGGVTNIFRSRTRHALMFADGCFNMQQRKNATKLLKLALSNQIAVRRIYLKFMAVIARVMVI